MTRLIPIKTVEELTSLKKSAIYERIQNGAFPKPVKLSQTTSRWSSEEIQQWIEDALQARVSA